MTALDCARLLVPKNKLRTGLALLGSLFVIPLVFLIAIRSGTAGPIAATLVLFGIAVGSLFAAVVGQKDGDVIHLGKSDRDRVRNWLDQRFDQPSERRRLAILAVTVEIPLSFSETSGAEVSPDILAELADRLATDLREDDLIARGETSDFLVCLSRVRAPQMETLDRLARRLQASAHTSITIHGRSVHPRLTIGIASARLTPAATGLELVTAAEDALEVAECQGVGSRIIADAPATRANEDCALVSELSEALANGQITAWYQPQVATETGEVSGFEALARWEHPTRGVISPASFLPMIDRAGLSRKLAKVILTHALSAIRTWDRAGLDIPGVGVNFAADELRDPNLADFLKWELDRFDLAPSRLVVEVLESVISETHEDAIARNLRAISAMGCRIDLDDFGTGYTSIINIRRFDVSRIKIDRKLVTGAATDATQRDLIAALLSMSEHLHVDTLGEGVETNEEHLALAQLGCGHVQGFAIARPMPLGDTLAWTLEHRANMAQARALTVKPTEVR